MVYRRAIAEGYLWMKLVINFCLRQSTVGSRKNPKRTVVIDTRHSFLACDTPSIHGGVHIARCYRNAIESRFHTSLVWVQFVRQGRGKV